jgi:hypothetical protein
LENIIAMMQGLLNNKAGGTPIPAVAEVEIRLLSCANRYYI